MWQQRDQERRLYDYGGESFDNKEKRADLSDMLFVNAVQEFGLLDRFGDTIIVKDLMETRTSRLCYIY
jgi:hypothetical protein